MPKFWTCLALAAVLFLGLTPRGSRAADEKPLDLSSIIDKNGGGKAPAEEMPPGDNKTFDYKTDGDLTLLRVGAVYRTGNVGEKTYFQVREIPSQSSSGGAVVFTRISGKADIPDGLARHQGEGPETLTRRVTAMDYFFMGGFTMYFLAALAFASIALTLNGVWLYWPSRHISAKFVESARAALRQQDVKAFRELSLNSRGLLPAICRALTERFSSSTIEDMKERAQIVASARITTLRLPIKALNFISVAAPLVGLFGTIIGMIVVFQAVGGATGAAKATALASGIRIKLMCTAAGLSVAIPSLTLFFIYNSLFASIIARCEIISEQFLHRLVVIKRASAAGEVADEEEAVEAAPAPKKKPKATRPASLEDDV